MRAVLEPPNLPPTREQTAVGALRARATGGRLERAFPGTSTDAAEMRPMQE
jgi:hypothetical protein